MGSAKTMPTTDEPRTALGPSGAERVAPAPQLPGFVREPTAAFWGALSRVRGKRIFHPDGVAYEAQLHVHGEGDPTGAATTSPGARVAVVRASRVSAFLSFSLHIVRGPSAIFDSPFDFSTMDFLSTLSVYLLSHTHPSLFYFLSAYLTLICFPTSFLLVMASRTPT
jgi:hypothetical protein